MESIGFSLDHLYLVVNTFQFAGVDRVITMIQNTISPSLQHVGKFVHIRMVNGSGKRTPLIQAFLRPSSPVVVPDQLKVLFQNHHLGYGLIQIHKTPQMSTSLLAANITFVANNK